MHLLSQLKNEVADEDELETPIDPKSDGFVYKADDLILYALSGSNLLIFTIICC